MTSFVHLHLHTEYSLLDGANRIALLPEYIKSLGMDACAITDHGVMYGALEFYLACQKAGIHPILGAEVYVAPTSRFERNPEERYEAGHLILLAESDEGLRNLNRLVTLGFKDGFYGRPRIDHEILQSHHEGLIALSACLSGEIPRALRQQDEERAENLAKWYASVFGPDHFYLEIQANGMNEQNLMNARLVRLARKLDLPLVATNDCHYMRQEDAPAQEILMCLQTGRRLRDENRMKMETDQLYVKSPEEMAAAFPDLPEALENTVKIANRCKAQYHFGTLHLPKYQAPGETESVQMYLSRLCREGLRRRLKIHQAAPLEEYEKRLDYELSVINSMGFTDYYLIVWDFIDYARRQGILVGPGRGSGASSLAAYCLGITNIDPLRYQLIFERFLNVDRVSMPDFDIDFCYERRQEVIDYVYQKYGEERVCQVITFGTLAAKAVVRDVARVLDYPYPDTDRLAKMIPNALGMTLSKAMEQNPELKKAYEEDKMVHQILDYALKLEGMPRHASTHAAGVIICGDPITDYAPLSRNDEAMVVQYTKNYIESIGLLKFDFLGLRTLTVLRDAADFIEQNHGKRVVYEDLDLADPAVFQMIGRGDTEGVFQLESAGMIAFIKELKPETLEDVIAGISLFRPGPMEQIPRYVNCRHHPEQIRYDHPLLEPILRVTYGCIVYQEQVMQIVRDLAGFSMGMSDIVRRAMAKKKPEELAKYEELFLFGGTDEKGNHVSGCIARGVSEEVGRKIFAEVKAFAGYAFNKPHAAAYAVIAYYTAWLKLYYPTEFMAAILNSYMGNLGQAAWYLQVCRKYGISVLPLDLNRSQAKFSTEGQAIRFALAAVKNVGGQGIRALLEERERGGPFQDPGDFWRRMEKSSLNRKMQESLIKAGGMDSFGLPRAKILSALEPYLNLLASKKNSNMEGQYSIFDLYGGEKESLAEPPYQEVPEFSKRDLLAMEQEMLGLYVSGHPLDEYRKQLEKERTQDSRALLPEGEEGALADGSPFSTIAYLRSVQKKTTKNGEQMLILLAEDDYASFECILFPKAYLSLREEVEEASVCRLQGRIQRRDENAATLILQRIQRLQPDHESDVMATIPSSERSPREEKRSAPEKENEKRESQAITDPVKEREGSYRPQRKIDSILPDTEEEVVSTLLPEMSYVPSKEILHSVEGERESLRPKTWEESETDLRLIFHYPSQRPKEDLQALVKLLRQMSSIEGPSCVKLPTGVHVERTDKIEPLDETYWLPMKDEVLQKVTDFWGVDAVELG